MTVVKETTISTTQVNRGDNEVGETKDFINFSTLDKIRKLRLHSYKKCLVVPEHTNEVEIPKNEDIKYEETFRLEIITVDKNKEIIYNVSISKETLFDLLKGEFVPYLQREKR